MTTTEADPYLAASYLRSIKQNQERERLTNGGYQEKVIYHEPEQYKGDWFSLNNQAVKESLHRESLWDNPSPVSRGRDFETLRGVNIGGNHPVIDDYVMKEGVATSMKSMNLKNDSYINHPEHIYSAGKDYVDAFSSSKFDNGVKMPDGTKIPKDQVQGFHLEIGVPSTMTKPQYEQLLEVQRYGVERNVRVMIVQVE